MADQMPEDTEKKADITPATETQAEKNSEPKARSFTLPAITIPTISRRMKRRAALAASLAIAACFGASVGALVSTSREPEKINLAAIAEREAMLQKTVATLNKEVFSLRTTVEAGNKNATTQIAKLEGRLERATADQITTGSINKSAPVAPPAVAAVPVPAPRPANVETKPVVLQNWTVRSVRGDLALLEGPQGLYEVMEGDPVPGLGRIDTIKRQDGRWVVVTPKGMIVSSLRPPAPRYYDRY